MCILIFIDFDLISSKMELVKPKSYFKFWSRIKNLKPSEPTPSKPEISKSLNLDNKLLETPKVEDQQNLFDIENNFSFIETIEKLVKQNDKGSNLEFNLQDFSTEAWVNKLQDKKNSLKSKLKKFFQIRETKLRQESHKISPTRGRRGESDTEVILTEKSGKKELPRKPRNFSSKKIKPRISKSNNITKNRMNDSNDIKEQYDMSVLDSNRRRILGSSSKKNQIVDKRDRQKSEIPLTNQKLSKIEKIFSKRFSNLIPFPEKMYKLLGVLGKGSYGQVFLAVHLMSGQKVAIKAIKKNRNNDMIRNYKKIINEIDIFAKLQHKNVICLFEVFENAKHIFLVTEYAEKGANELSIDSEILLITKTILSQSFFNESYIHKTMHTS